MNQAENHREARLNPCDDRHNDLIHIVYVSTAASDFSMRDLPALLDQARRNNNARCITGLLIYSDGYFFQVLEGEESTVDYVFAKIREDSRHANVSTIIREPIARRSFAEWSLQFMEIKQEELKALEGFEDIADYMRPNQSIGQGRAKRLVSAFQSGKWRTALNPQRLNIILEQANFSIAFQPIVDMEARKVFSHEALVRGPLGEPAYKVFESVDPSRMAGFDFAIRKKAVEFAMQLELGTAINLNFLPQSANADETGLEATLAEAERVGMKPQSIIFEATETEVIADPKRFAAAIQRCKRSGAGLAIDDFGAGYAGLNLLAEFQPDFVKLDMGLVRDVHEHGPRQAISRSLITLCDELGITLVVEGIETYSEYRWFRNLGVELFQGYLFAKPMFEGRPLVRFPD